MRVVGGKKNKEAPRQVVGNIVVLLSNPKMTADQNNV